MTAFPVLLRECRVEARRPINHWLRLLGAAFMVFVFGGLLTRNHDDAALLGARLFPQFHTILLVAIVIIAPLLTADCLAQEKREGTLPLLLLTRLTPGGIVVAKMLAHALRGYALVLGALPVLCVPFLLGGVSPAEMTISSLLCASLLMLGLGGGIFASALTESPTRATILAIGFGFSLCAAFVLAYGWCFAHWLAPLRSSAGLLTPAAFGSWPLLGDYDQYWAKTLAQFPGGGSTAWVALMKVLFVASGLVVILLIQCAGWVIHRGGVERTRANATRPVRGFVRGPRFWREWLARRQRRHLRHNPIYWLQQRTLNARLAKWGWCGFVVAGEGLLWLAPSRSVWATGQIIIGVALMLGIIHASASSYRREQHNGMLEMILVTPIRAWRLVSGRVRWLWMQFLPACLLWLGATQVSRQGGIFSEDLLRFGCYVFGVWLVGPVTGLDCAINFRTHWRALLATCGAVLLVPATIFLYDFSEGWRSTLISCVVLWVVGILTAAGLELQMRERRFRYLHPQVVRRHRFRRTSRRPRPARVLALGHK